MLDSFGNEHQQISCPIEKTSKIFSSCSSFYTLQQYSCTIANRMDTAKLQRIISIEYKPEAATDHFRTCGGPLVPLRGAR